MKNKYYAATTIYAFFFSLSLNAQETPAPANAPVTKGKVEALGEKLPVYAGVKQVELSEGSVSYSMPVKNEKQMYALVKKVEALYTGKKLLGAKVPKFKKDEQPGSAAISWTSTGCKPGANGPMIVITGDRRELTVSVWIRGQCPAE